MRHEDFFYNRSTQYIESVDAELYEEISDVVFCEESKGGAILENEYAVAVLDGFPVSDGHTLVIPKRHFADYFDITEKEQQAINNLIRVRRKWLLEEDKTVLGFNVGVNAGAAAGQTVWHCHIHLIPRRHGDTPNPRSGVRRVIPLKANYEPGK
ncbi:MAG: HIT family protein [Deltaproteobacteria bacterium]|nr:HIT family protein [Deltaproteobacteria bacterium]